MSITNCNFQSISVSTRLQAIGIACLSENGQRKREGVIQTKRTSTNRVEYQNASNSLWIQGSMYVLLTLKISSRKQKEKKKDYFIDLKSSSFIIIAHQY